MRLRVLVAATCTNLTSVAHAHPGHGSPASNLLHYLVEPAHALPFLVAGAVLWVVLRRARGTY